MKNHRTYSVILWGWMCVLCTSILGCIGEKTELPTKGSLTIVASETVSPMIRQQEEKFESLYQDAHLTVLSAPTREAITRIFNDTIKFIVSSRPLNTEEREVAKREKIDFKEYKIAIDGIAVIVNSENTVSRLRTTQLDSIMQGLTTYWDDVGGKRRSIDLFIPDQNAGEFEVVGMKILGGKRFTDHAVTVKSSPDMIKAIIDHPDAIGIIGVNWLREKNEKIKVLELSDPFAADSLQIKGQYFAPFQAHLYRGYYPLASDVYIYSKTDMYSVGSGFISFITSAPGQKIVLDNGMVPVTMPIRLVELTNKGIKP
jgi:ABC-type phosphate transport system substrate-binding protein